jgi:hypothetical protein
MARKRPGVIRSSRGPTTRGRTKDASYIEKLLAPLFGGSPTGGPVPTGYTPLGRNAACSGSDPAEIPKTPEELGELLSYSYDMTVRQAGELNIPVVGSVSGGFERRVVVYEWTRYKTLFGDGEVQCRYGYVLRFCLTVSKWDVQLKATLPFLSAQAELGNLQASWMMQVRGLTGKKIDAVVLPPQELKVETFIIARQSLDAAIKAIEDPTTKFVPGILLCRIDPAAPEAKLRAAAVGAYAIDCVRRGRSRVDAQGRLGSPDPPDNDRVTEVYADFGIQDPKTIPGAGSRESADRILRGLRVDT